MSNACSVSRGSGIVAVHGGGGEEELIGFGGCHVGRAHRRVRMRYYTYGIRHNIWSSSLILLYFLYSYVRRNITILYLRFVKTMAQ
jgi:hypothetical protein